MEDLNRLKVVLAEKKEDKQMACRRIRAQHNHCFKMVHQFFAAGSPYIESYCSSA